MEKILLTVQFRSNFLSIMSRALHDTEWSVKLIEETSFKKREGLTCEVSCMQWIVGADVFAALAFVYKVGKYRVPGIEFTRFEHNVIL
jgi:hypothetical protein